MEITEELIRQLVVEVVEKIENMKAQSSLGSSSVLIEDFRSKVLTGEDIEYLFRRKVEVVRVKKKTIITPLGHERSRDLGVEIELV